MTSRARSGSSRWAMPGGVHEVGEDDRHELALLGATSAETARPAGGTEPRALGKSVPARGTGEHASDYPGAEGPTGASGAGPAALRGPDLGRWLHRSWPTRSRAIAAAVEERVQVEPGRDRPCPAAGGRSPRWPGCRRRSGAKGEPPRPPIEASNSVTPACRRRHRVGHRRPAGVMQVQVERVVRQARPQEASTTAAMRAGWPCRWCRRARTPRRRPSASRAATSATRSGATSPSYGSPNALEIVPPRGGRRPGPTATTSATSAHRLLDGLADVLAVVAVARRQEAGQGAGLRLDGGLARRAGSGRARSTRSRAAGRSRP